MKIIALLIMFSAASSLSAQQTEGLKTEKTAKTSILERRIPEKSNDSIAKKNLSDILKQNTGGNSILGTASPYSSEIQTNVNRLNNNVNSFNSNMFDRMQQTQGRGIHINKRK
ncbi:hypothetical protein [uncultured Chryseobacterium sp.]|uniref:hypothetical protein n=1 Tax=uncultured Chryseobacterium sp. TaxID=259322 RepID=UPI0025FCD2A4|nr:hypothetical protein [uncultured Chryseobacterium sp.]